MCACQSIASPHFHFKELVHNKIDLIGAQLTAVQDHQGFMWFGGENGLARYDGHELVIYRNDS